MQRLPTLSLALLFAGLVTASACTVGSPTTSFGQGKGTGTSTDNPDMAGSGTNPPTDTVDMAPRLTTPQPSSYAQTSVWTTVPVRGTTSPPNSAVLITAMDGTSTSADVDGSGSFCANVVLQPNKVNTFQLVTHDVNSGMDSAPVSITITQAGQPQQGTPAQPSENASLGGSGTVFQIGTGGTAAAQQVTDGDPSTWVEDSYDQDGYSFPAPAVMVQLNATSSINQIVAVLPSDCPMDATLVLAYSSQSAPASPGPGATGWTVTNATRSADGFTWKSSFNPATATFVAAWWTGVSLSSTFDEGGCGFEWSDFGLAELQGWTAPGVAQPPQTAPMCGI